METFWNTEYDFHVFTMAWADCGSSIYYRTANNLHYTAQPYGAGEGLCTRPSKGEMASNLPEKWTKKQ